MGDSAIVLVEVVFVFSWSLRNIRVVPTLRVAAHMRRVPRGRFRNVDLRYDRRRERRMSVQVRSERGRLPQMGKPPIQFQCDCIIDLFLGGNRSLIWR